jgi:hypothetical protein
LAGWRKNETVRTQKFLQKNSRGGVEKPVMEKGYKRWDGRRKSINWRNWEIFRVPVLPT